MSTLQIIDQEKRRLIDIGLAAARRRISPQTGWVHFCYETADARHDTIPLLENFCLVLALFRSRLSEDVLQGRELLQKLFAFEVSGHFPVYLHEYPHIRDRGLAIDILMVLLHLKREFFNVLGENLEVKLITLIARIIEQAEREEHGSYGRRAKLQAAQGKFRLVPNRKIHSSAQLADELIALQVQGGYSSDDLLAISRYWHSGLKMYRGPLARELQEGTRPQPNLFNFFMGQLFGGYPSQVLEGHPIHMRAALVYPFHVPAPDCDADPYLWLTDQESNAVHLFWDSGDKTHSLVIQGVAQGAISWQALGDSLFAIDCILSEEAPSSSEEKSEVNCFFDYHPDHAIRIEGKRANAFYLKQPLTIQSSSLAIEMEFSILEGEGKFFGHLLRGNRPRQIGNRGEKRFTAFDWQIALRTVSRQAACTLRILCKLAQCHYP